MPASLMRRSACSARTAPTFRAETVLAGFTNTYYLATDLRGDGTAFKLTPTSGRPLPCSKPTPTRRSRRPSFLLVARLRVLPAAGRHLHLDGLSGARAGGHADRTQPGPGDLPCDNPGGVAGAPGKAYINADPGVIPAERPVVVAAVLRLQRGSDLRRRDQPGRCARRQSTHAGLARHDARAGGGPLRRIRHVLQCPRSTPDRAARTAIST
ncbi:MAG: hypothetical protein R2710_14375 [Acidimicrobiales bacterium]